MSCIVGVFGDGKMYIGGDSGATCGYKHLVSNVPKVFRNGEFIFGFIGSYRMGQILRVYFSPPSQIVDTTDYEYLATLVTEHIRSIFKEHGFQGDNEREGGTFLIGYRGIVYVMYSDYHINWYNTGTVAIGSGEDYALGSLLVTSMLEPRARIEAALQVAAMYTGTVKPPFIIIGDDDDIQGSGEGK